MDDTTVYNKLRKLIEEITNSRTKNQQSTTDKEHKKDRSATDKITKSLDSLQICIKYLLFDLEATRRERDTAEKKLKDLKSQDEDD